MRRLEISVLVDADAGTVEVLGQPPHFTERSNTASQQAISSRPDSEPGRLTIMR